MTPMKTLGLAALAVVSLSAAAHDVPRGAGGPPARFLVASHATAHVAMPVIDVRQARQARWIARGAADGRLTAAETARLQAQQRRIARVEWRAKADGVVTLAERQRLDRLLDRAARHIRHEMRDRQVARR